MAGAGFKDFTIGEVLTSSDVDQYLMQQTVMRFASSAARGSALGTAVGAGTALAEGMVTYLDDADRVELFDGTTWKLVGTSGYALAGIVYFTSNGSFDKTDPLGTGDIDLRAIRVTVIGGGGGSGGVPATGGSAWSIAGSGGGGGGARRLITDIAGLSNPESITVGSGGSGGAAGANAGSAGGSSIAFGITCTGGGGGGAGVSFTASGNALVGGGGQGSASGTFDLELGGGGAGFSMGFNGARFCGEPGSSFIGSNMTIGGKLAGTLYGQGGRAPNAPNDRGADTGANGAGGLVIVECYV